MLSHPQYSNVYPFLYLLCTCSLLEKVPQNDQFNPKAPIFTLFFSILSTFPLYINIFFQTPHGRERERATRFSTSLNSSSSNSEIIYSISILKVHYKSHKTREKAPPITLVFFVEKHTPKRGFFSLFLFQFFLM